MNTFKISIMRSLKVLCTCRFFDCLEPDDQDRAEMILEYIDIVKKTPL